MARSDRPGVPYANRTGGPGVPPLQGPVKPGSIREAKTPEIRKSQPGRPAPSPPDRRENRFMTNLMVVLHTILSDRDAAEKRLKEYGYKNVRRDIGLLVYLVDKLQREMLETMPERRLNYYARMAKEAQIVIDFPGAVPRGRHLLVEVRDLAAITEAAMRSECVLCMRDGREVKNCRLREALITVAPPSEWSRTGCEYRNPASQLIQGEDVTI